MDKVFYELANWLTGLRTGVLANCSAALRTGELKGAQAALRAGELCVFYEVALLVFAPTGHALRDSVLTCSERAMEIRTCSGVSDKGRSWLITGSVAYQP